MNTGASKGWPLFQSPGNKKKACNSNRHMLHDWKKGLCA